MIDKNSLDNRYQILYKSLYELAKQYAERRQRIDGEASPATHYHSTISRAMENPARSKLETIEGIVEALGGELRIIWEPEKTITLQLDNEQIAALQERAENESLTTSKVAEQILQLAFSGKLAQKPVIAEEAKIYRSMHPLIESAYSNVHQWLGTRPEAQGYKELDYKKDLWEALETNDLKNVAFQFYTLFPRYDFEAAHVEDYIISSTRLETVLKHNRHICILDVGCAMGAASAAFIEKVITWQEDENTTHPIEIFCLGIDPSIDGIVIYSKLMEEIKQNLISVNINLEFKPICDRFPTGIVSIKNYLKEKLEDWNKPVFSNLFVMQLNTASSSNQDAITRETQYKKLQELGLEPDLILKPNKEFWHEEILGYQQLLDTLPIEELHILTIGTKHLEKNIEDTTNFNNIQEGIDEISKLFKEEFKNKHSVKTLLKSEQSVIFENPIDSYWSEQNQISGISNFYALFQAINNDKLVNDNSWNQLLSQENLELAYVRARKNLLDEALYDEIEIYLFENNFQNNIQNIREKLTYYTEDAIPNNQEIPYKFPKSSVTTRPKQLSRLEQEIIATALMQTIGKNTGREFSAYRLQKDSDATATEYLYESWWELFKLFREEIIKSCQEYPNGGVLRTDIKSYYTQVVQKELLETTKKELDITSTRIIWLLKKLFDKEFDGHETGKGLNQGTITSGFYANLYLSDIDEKFHNNSQYRVKYHRYVDDIIIIVPNPKEISEIESILREGLKQKKLVLNQHKTEYYETTADFINTFQDDGDIQKIGKEFNKTLYDLWIMDVNYQNSFNLRMNDSEWWNLINIYQQCLYSIEIYVDKRYLSRKIRSNLFMQTSNDKHKLVLPPLPQTNDFRVILNWSKSFQNLSRDWFRQKSELKTNINKFLTTTLENLIELDEKLNKNSDSISKGKKKELFIERRRLETRIRFAINKLSILGFDGVWQEIVHLICNNLFIIRDLLDIIISLARQGYTNAIKQIWDFYQNRQEGINENQGIEYIRAVILESIRFLPNLDVENWQLIFESATEGTSDIEKLKATETWLYLGDIAKQFVQAEHIQAVVTALNSEPQPFTRLKKNYILILGIHKPALISEIKIYEQEKNDYLIRDALKLIEDGKVSDLFQEDEPAIVRQYYSVKKADDSNEKLKRSLY